MSSRPHWYEIFIHECPVCGHSKTYKERRYTKKPKQQHKRYHISIYYDYCMERGG